MNSPDLWFYKKAFWGVPVVAQWVKNPTVIPEDGDLIPGLAQWTKDPALLWLWCRPAAVAPIQPLAWEPPQAVGVALKSKQKKGLVVSL